MKIGTGKIGNQLSFGITFTNYHNQFRAIIFDFALWYVEFIFQDYETEEMDSGSKDS